MTTGHDLAMCLRDAYLAVHRRANAHFARFGVTADQFIVLTALARGDAVSQAELVRRCRSDPNTVRAILMRLERLGLVARGPNATDARARSVVLTGQGRRMQRELWAVNESSHAEMLALFPPEALGDLLGTLDRIAALFRPTV